MAQVTITLTDELNGQVNVAADFGEAVVDDSQAHGMGQQLLQAILGSAERYTTVEDTAPDTNVEPPRIITATNLPN
ncbi:hypothetical protein [Aquabacterium sp.]|uniref:hypothetical protein n=1 Tax=Aquabacterium sp. TaxID=1872578 RepID=UPI00248A4508|nr:hypothetical protein [Aquabacterium sp.]MDI1347914.1 hypothetical protein [Aquabacterium sp.]